MLLRLLLALVIALSTAPAAVAMPACHGAMPMMGQMDHHAPKPSKAIPSEALCLGCVAPATVRPPVIIGAFSTAGVPPIVRALAGKRLVAVAPATPPPRAG